MRQKCIYIFVEVAKYGIRLDHGGRSWSGGVASSRRRRRRRRHRRRRSKKEYATCMHWDLFDEQMLSGQPVASSSFIGHHNMAIWPLCAKPLRNHDEPICVRPAYSQGFSAALPPR